MKGWYTMYVSFKAPVFSDKELEKIYFVVKFAYDELMDLSDPEWTGDQEQYAISESELLRSILTKIEKRGSFSK